MKSLSLIFAAFSSSLVTSFIFVYTFRFPVLRLGYVGPLGDHSPYGLTIGEQAELLWLVGLNWFQWGMLGNFVALPVLALLVGVIANKFRLKDRQMLLMALIAGTLPIFYIALYDVFAGI